MAQWSSNGIGTFLKKDIRDAVVSARSARLQLKQDTSNDIRRKSNGIQAIVNNMILDVRAQSTVNTLPKNLLKTSAFMLGSVVIVSSSISRPAEVTYDFSLLLIKLKKLPRLFNYRPEYLNECRHLRKLR